MGHWTVRTHIYLRYQTFFLRTGSVPTPIELDSPNSHCAVVPFRDPDAARDSDSDREPDPLHDLFGPSDDESGDPGPEDDNCLADYRSVVGQEDDDIDSLSDAVSRLSLEATGPRAPRCSGHCTHHDRHDSITENYGHVSQTTTINAKFNAKFNFSNIIASGNVIVNVNMDTKSQPTIIIGSGTASS